MTERESDISNITPSSPHRLPTLSASQALRNLVSPEALPLPASHPEHPPSSCSSIGTGLKGLDVALGRVVSVAGTGTGTGTGAQSSQLSTEGLQRGKVLEVYGPPGVGKTALCLQIASLALAQSPTNHVVWLDCNFPLASPRIKDHIPAACLTRFHRYTTPTFPHLLALIFHPPPTFPPPNAAVIVIDSLSTVYQSAYPRAITATPTNTTKSPSLPPSKRFQLSRRHAILDSLAARLTKLAAVHDTAIVVSSQAVTVGRGEHGSSLMLESALGTREWLHGIAVRVRLCWNEGIRMAHVFKGGNESGDGEGSVGFVVCKNCVKEISLAVASMPVAMSSTAEYEATPTPAPRPVNYGVEMVQRKGKRKRSAIPDSESEEDEDEDEEDDRVRNEPMPNLSSDYGWNDDDDDQLGTTIE